MPNNDFVQQVTARRKRKASAKGIGLGGLGGAIVPEVTIPETPIRSRCLLALGADLSQPWQSWNWVELPDVRWDEGINITRGSQDRDSFVRASSASFRAGNNDAALSRGNPNSPFYGLIGKFNPIMLLNDVGLGFTPRYFGFTSDLPKLWRDRSAVDSVIDIKCRGPLDHIKRNKTTGSSLTRYYRSTAPSAWWPMESGDQRATISTPSAVAGVADLTATNTAGPYVVAGAVGGAIVGPPGADRAIDLSQGGRLYANLPVGQFDSSATAWRYEMGMISGTMVGGDTRVLTIHFGDFKLEMIGHSDPDDEAGVFVENIATGTGDFGEVFPESVMTDGAWHLIQVDMLQDGTVANIVVCVDGVEYINENTVTAPYANPSYVEISQDGQADGVSEAVFWIGDNVPADSSLSYAAFQAHTAEMFHQRAARVCAQANIPFFTNAATSAMLGPQPSGTTLQILEDGVKADGGDIFEHEFGLGLKALSEYMNQPVSLALDIAQGHVPDDLFPTDSTQNYYNTWTVRRSSDNVFTTETVQGGVPDTEPVFGGEDHYNLYSTAQLTDLASWLANRDANDLDRWPAIKLMLHKNPEFVPDWYAMQFGARFTVDNMMTTLGYTQLNLHMMGNREFWNSKRYEVILNGTDANYFDVGSLEDDQYRLDSDSSEILDDMDSTQTEFIVFTDNVGDLWTTDADEFPFDILIGGEAITLGSEGVAGIANLVTDNFDRDETDTWGLADSGQSYELIGTAANFDTTTTGTNKATILMPTGDLTPQYALLPEVVGDFTAIFQTGFNAAATGNYLNSFLAFRWRDVNSYYRVVLQFATDTLVDIVVQRVVNGTATTIATNTDTGIDYLASVQRICRVDVRGSDIRVKLYNSDEPSEHVLQVEDTTFSSPGRIGVGAFLTSGNTNTNPLALYDDIYVINPQTFTGTRSVNNIVKSHLKNRGKLSEVHVRYPIRLTP